MLLTRNITMMFIFSCFNLIGNDIGNLYFATWFGFGLAILLTFTTFKQMIAPESTEEESQHPDASKTGAAQQEGEQERQGQGQGGQGHQGGEEQLEEVDVKGRDEDV